LVASFSSGWDFLQEGGVEADRLAKNALKSYNNRMTIAHETRRTPVFLNPHTYGLLRRASELNGETLVGTIYDALKGHLAALGDYRAGVAPSPFSVKAVAKGVRIAHPDFRPVVLAHDEVATITDAMLAGAGRIAGSMKGSVMTRARKVPVKVWNGGRFVGLSVDGVTVRLPLPVALDLADAIRACVL
jgi:hypothetical protein